MHSRHPFAIVQSHVLNHLHFVPISSSRRQPLFPTFQEFQDRGYSPNFGIYADLFNACANSPPIHKDRALVRATTLRNKLSKQYTTMPKPVYNNMIKAFGRCGDLESAFDILDEMKEQRLLVDSEALNHLLQGCISDKEAGFR